MVFRYVYINYLNSFLINSRIKIGVKLKSKLKKPKIAEFEVLKSSLLYIIALLEAKNLSNLPKVEELYETFFW